MWNSYLSVSWRCVLGESVPMQCSYAQWLGWEIYIWSEQGWSLPWSVLVATKLVINGAGVGGARARARCKLRLCSVAITALSWVELVSKGLELEPWGNWVFPGFLHLGLGVSRAWGFEAALLFWFQFSPICMLWLEVGSGQRGWCHITEQARSA